MIEMARLWLYVPGALRSESTRDFPFNHLTHCTACLVQDSRILRSSDSLPSYATCLMPIRTKDGMKLGELSFGSSA